MNPRNYITIALGVACLVLSVATQLLKKGNETLQASGQQRMVQITNVQRLNQSPALKGLIQAMANLSATNPKIKAVLEANGFTIQLPPEPAQEPAPAATPAATPVPTPVPVATPEPQPTPETPQD